jgi:hypothetical protein
MRERSGNRKTMRAKDAQKKKLGGTDWESGEETKSEEVKVEKEDNYGEKMRAFLNSSF